MPRLHRRFNRQRVDTTPALALALARLCSAAPECRPLPSAACPRSALSHRLCWALQVHSNGYFTFGPPQPQFNIGHTRPLPSEGAPDNIVGVYWSDLDPSRGGSVFR